MRPDDGLTARYPADLASRVTVRLKNGESFTQQISDFPGAPARPFTWKEIDAKFDKMAAGHIDEGLSQEIKECGAFAGEHPSQRIDAAAGIRTVR